MDTVFSSQLQRLRKEHNVTQETLAAHLGVSPQAVSKWENGSYPDGDLLPKIADFFGVSIDYLYGRAKEDASVVQQIIDELQKSFQSSENSEKLFFEQAMKYVWAIQTASWAANKYYYDRPELNVTDSITVSELSSKEGFSYMRLNKDLEYYFLVKQPKEGFAKRLRITDEMAELFAFLGDKTNLKILQYMLSLNWKEAVRAKTIAKLINIPVEKAEKALDFLCKFNGMFTKGSIICGIYKPLLCPVCDLSKFRFLTSAEPLNSFGIADKYYPKGLSLVCKAIRKGSQRFDRAVCKVLRFVKYDDRAIGKTGTDRSPHIIERSFGTCTYQISHKL